MQNRGKCTSQASSPGSFPWRVSQCCISDVCDLRVSGMGAPGLDARATDSRTTWSGEAWGRGFGAGRDPGRGQLSPLLLLLVGRLRPREVTGAGTPADHSQAWPSVAFLVVFNKPPPHGRWEEGMYAVPGTHLTGDAQDKVGGGAEQALGWTLEGALRGCSFPGCDLWHCPPLARSFPWASLHPLTLPSQPPCSFCLCLPPLAVCPGGQPSPSAIPAMLRSLGARPSHRPCLLWISHSFLTLVTLSPPLFSGTALLPPRGQSAQTAHHLELSLSCLLPLSPGLESGCPCCLK